MSKGMLKDIVCIMDATKNTNDDYLLRIGDYLENSFYNFNVSKNKEEKEKFLGCITRCVDNYNKYSASLN